MTPSPRSKLQINSGNLNRLTLKEIWEKSIIFKNNDLGIDILLVSDEPYRDIVYDNSVVPYIPKFYDNTIVAYFFSKSFSLPVYFFIAKSYNYNISALSQQL